MAEGVDQVSILQEFAVSKVSETDPNDLVDVTASKAITNIIPFCNKV